MMQYVLLLLLLLYYKILKITSDPKTTIKKNKRPKEVIINIFIYTLNLPIIPKSYGKIVIVLKKLGIKKTGGDSGWKGRFITL